MRDDYFMNKSGHLVCKNDNREGASGHGRPRGPSENRNMAGPRVGKEDRNDPRIAQALQREATREQAPSVSLQEYME